MIIEFTGEAYESFQATVDHLTNYGVTIITVETVH